MKSKYFEKELARKGSLTCPCGCNAKMNDDTINKLDKLRELYGKPIYVEQGATCEEYSVHKVGRKPTSSHIDNGSGATGVDIQSRTFGSKTDYFNFISFAVQVGFKGIGQGAFWLGCGKDRRLHIDTKNNYIRSWVYGV